MKTLRLNAILMLIILAGCAPVSRPAVNNTTTPSVTATKALATPVVDITRAPDAEAAAKSFLEDWKTENYTAMYAMLTKVSQDAITQDDFTARYKKTAEALTLKALEYGVTSAMTKPASAQVAYQVTFHTNLVGDIARQMTMNLERDATANTWRVQWEDGLIMPELKGGNTLAMEVSMPSRGNIYDHTGEAIASQADAVAIYVHTGELIPSQEGTMIEVFSQLTGKNPEAIKALYRAPLENGQDWPVVIGEATLEAVQKREGTLSGLAGVYWEKYRNRYYPDGGVAPHAVGYVSAIYPDEVDDYLRLGYQKDQIVGRSGIEQWGENYLAGSNGAKLYVLDKDGNIVTKLTEKEAQPADSITTTLDYNLQEQTQKAISGFNAAAVVLERDTGRVLAMASSPGFDPNLLIPNNPNAIQTNNQGDFYNRAAMGTYPLGSVFKIISMSAALESGIWTKDSTYDCQQTWTELEGVTLHDWTLEYGVPASGMLNLPEGLMRSCDPWFYHIGLGLYRQEGAEYMAKLARAFGLGSKTGIESSGIQENPGNVVDPGSEIDAVHLSIGQYTLLVTPLQVADYVAAVGNGGTLYKPQMIEKISPLDGDPVFTFKKEVRGTLPVSPANLKIVQDAMRTVISDNRGTAHFVFVGMQTPIYGKTGTAQSDQEKPHAWFAAYTNANNPDKPDIAVAVVAEYAGEGSDFAAPMVRRILEVYYSGQPQRLYPWEQTYNVTKTPTPIASDTPIPQDTETPTPEVSPAP